MNEHRLAAYRRLLHRHDWKHVLSADMAEYHRGQNELQRLREAQQALDPDFAVWNAHCHPWCRDGRDYPA